MKKTAKGLLLIATLLLGLQYDVSAAEKLDKARNVVDRVRQPDPPRVSSTTKPSPAGQPAREYRPAPSSLKIKEPPAPARNRVNPRNDPDVQKGYDKHQKAYRDK